MPVQLHTEIFFSLVTSLAIFKGLLHILRAGKRCWLEMMNSIHLDHYVVPPVHVIQEVDKGIRLEA